jgi:oligopeptide/dipeptide ABC transporter ATP-binding protein
VSDPVLEARDLSVTFVPRRGSAPVRAVDDVNLAVQKGEIIALVGESGCGKTTLARTLLGLELPSGGSVSYLGSRLAYSSRALRAYRRNVQLVQQDPTGSLNPRHTIYELVAQGVRIHRIVRERRAAGDPSATEVGVVSKAMSDAGLRPPERFYMAYPHELSGGQRQRVVIAGALALSPSVLVADEPVSSLDASIRGEILSLFLGLRDNLGLTVLVVTHDLGLAWNVADRIAVMYLGRIVEVGGTEEVLTRPKHPYTQALLSVVPEVAGLEPVVLSGETPDASRIPGGCRFHPRCPQFADQTAARAGMADRCIGTDPGVLPVTSPGGHASACWLTLSQAAEPHMPAPQGI